MFQNYFIASDFDRTMTDYFGEIPPANLTAVSEFQQGGGVFTIATGRSWPMFQHHYHRAGLTGTPVILYNGAAVYDPATDHVNVTHPLATQAIDLAFEIHKQYPQLYMEFQGVKAHYCFGHNPKRVEYLQKNHGVMLHNTLEGIYQDSLNVAFFAPDWVPSTTTARGNSPEEIAMFDHMEHMIGVENGHLVTPVRSMPRMLEMMSAGIGKGIAARALATQLGKSQLVCIGDAPNDLSMLEEADWAFITGDCQPDLLSLGYTQVANCGDGAVAAVIQQLKGETP
ncbi:MAG: HAD family hydrolase [Eubacteriales bacterium]